MKSFSCVIRCLDTDVSSSVSTRPRMPMRSAGKRWICQLGSFFCLSTFLSFLSVCDFDSSLQQKTSGGSSRPYAVSLRASSLWAAAGVIFLSADVRHTEGKTCCELRPRAERILPPRCQPITATFSPTDETRSNHKFNSNLIFLQFKIWAFFRELQI